MIEGNKNSENDDLSAFADYLAEFDAIVSFDNETCGVCGVSISDTLSVQKSPFVQFKSLKEESEILVIEQKLELKGIPFKIEKQLDTSILNEIRYNYSVLIPFKFLNELQKGKI